MSEIKTILLTTDFSETSKKAFPHAKILAERYGARIILAYAATDRLPAMVVEYGDAGLKETLERQHEQAGEQLDRLAAEWFADLPVEGAVVLGTPHLEIVRLAEERGADLIVMATHGHGFISHAILGSTTERVLRQAPCPCFVVRDTGDDG